MDQISELTGARVTCVLIGERPGLLTAESMSAYLVFQGYVGIPESRRTVVSNIHGRGTVPAEAGAHIADVIKRYWKLKKRYTAGTVAGKKNDWRSHKSGNPGSKDNT